MDISVPLRQAASVNRSPKRPPSASAFQEPVGALNGPSGPWFALAAIDSLLSGFTAQQLREAVAAPPIVELSPYLSNYLAAMVESACDAQRLGAPA